MTRRIARRRAQIGLTDADYDALLAAQGGTCAITTCNAAPKTRRLDTDHDHKTGAVRGLLCHRHNRLMPAWITSADLRAMADYLDAHAPQHRAVTCDTNVPGGRTSYVRIAP